MNLKHKIQTLAYYVNTDVLLAIEKSLGVILQVDTQPAYDNDADEVPDEWYFGKLFRPFSLHLSFTKYQIRIDQFFKSHNLQREEAAWPPKNKHAIFSLFNHENRIESYSWNIFVHYF